MEYENYLVGLTSILREGWNTATNPEYRRQTRKDPSAVVNERARFYETGFAYYIITLSSFTLYYSKFLYEKGTIDDLGINIFDVAKELRITEDPIDIGSIDVYN